MSDLISRQAAIEVIYALQKDGCIALLDCAIDEVKNLPSAQPETHDKRTETHACDCISRQAAISVIAKWMLEYGGEGEERERNALKQAAEEIKDLPSTQPDLSEYSDKLWKRAYERGKAEAQPDLDDVYAHAETEAEARFHAQIVRCKECKWHLTYHDSKYNVGYALCGNPKMMIGDDMIEMSDNDYCSNAERRTNEGD